MSNSHAVELNVPLSREIYVLQMQPPVIDDILRSRHVRAYAHDKMASRYFTLLT